MVLGPGPSRSLAIRGRSLAIDVVKAQPVPELKVLESNVDLEPVRHLYI